MIGLPTQLHPNQISAWKQEFLEKSASVFESSNEEKKEEQVDTEALYSKIGKLEVERDFLKKKLEENQSVSMKRLLIDPQEELSIRDQCKLLDLNRGSFYYQPKGEKKENLEIMRLMDEYILEEPTAGATVAR